MGGQLYDPHLAGLAHAAHHHPVPLDRGVVVGVHAIVAVVVLDRIGAVIQPSCERPRPNDYPVLLADERAGQRRDD